MRRWLIVIVIELCSAGMLYAQPTNCVVSGYLFKPDGSPAVNAEVNAINVVKNGSSFVLTPIVLTTDASGFTSFTAPRFSTLWIVGTALGLSSHGDMAILIPDSDTAALDLLAQSAKPPVSGIALTSGAIPTLALSLEDFGINLNGGSSSPPTTVESFNGRTGPVTLTSSDINTALNFTPVDPGAVVGAVNASSDTIDNGRLSADVVRRNLANVFSSKQTFSNGLEVTGSNAPGSSAVSIVKGTNTSSGLDVRLDGTGKGLRFFFPGVSQPRTYFSDAGMLYTNGWMVISGTEHGSGDTYVIDHPSTDPFMVGVWSDVLGPALQVRNSIDGTGAYLFSGLNQAGAYTFSIESDGRLQWGASTRAAMDTSLYRSGPGSLSTSGAFLVNGRLNIGAVDTQLYRQGAGALRTDGSVSVGGTGLFGGPVYFGTADTMLYRNALSSLRTNSSVTVDGKLGVGGTNSEYPLYVLGSQSSAWNTSARFEASGNVNGGGSVVEVFPTTMPFGARLYGGRWSSTNRGARLAGRDQLGRENAWVHVNAEGASVAINTNGVDRVTVKSDGNVGINTATPAADAVLEVNGGDSRGFRIAPRSVPGSPTTGTWSAGTIIVDSTGSVYICVAAGSPGTWQKIGGQ